MFRRSLRVQLVILDKVDTKTFFFFNNNKVIIIYVINKSCPLQIAKPR